MGHYEYALYEKEPDELEDFLRHGDFTGLNVTIPYKKDVVPYCSALSDAARTLGSVNTLMRLPDGTLYGDNTDYDGFFEFGASKRRGYRGQKGVGPGQRRRLRHGLRRSACSGRAGGGHLPQR